MAAPSVDAIPPELRQGKRFCCWRAIPDKENPAKIGKVPWQADGFRKLAWSNPANLLSFDEAKVLFLAGLDLPAHKGQHFAGIGYILDLDSELVCIDLDHSINEAGEILPGAKATLGRFKSYTEKSPSGRGLHIWIKARIDGPNIPQLDLDGQAVEVFVRSHHVTLTGDALPGYEALESRQAEAEALYYRLQALQKPKGRPPGVPKKADGNRDQARTAWYVGKALEYEAQAVRDESEGNRNNRLNDAAFSIGRYAGAGHISEGDVERTLLRAARAAGLPEEEAGETVQSGLRAGMDNPTDPELEDSPESPNHPPGEQRHDREGPVLEISSEITEAELNAYSFSEGPKFECNLPKEHFIQRFMAYGSDISDAYIEYWFAGGLFALTVAADKKLKIVLKQGTIYPNLYISINGKSSLARKSTVVDKTEAMLCQVLPGLLSSLVPTEFSPEAFTEHLSDHNHAPWIRDEAAGVLSLMKRDYMRGFKDSLMQLFDCKPFYRKLRTSQRKGTKTEFRVDDPYLNVLFATTDASLGANTEQNDTLSGFMARFLFFFPQGKKAKWLPLEEGTSANSIFEDVVRSQLAGIAAKMGELQECTAMHFSTAAASYYTEWQRIREEEWTASNDGNAMQIYSRLAPTVTKLGMLFELGSPDFDVSRPIRLEFIQEACQLVDSYFMPTARAVYDLVGANAEKNVIDRIIAYLKKHNGKASKKEIMRDVKIKSADFGEYLATMIESSTVETKTVKRGGNGRDSLWVFLLDPATVGNVATVANVAIVTKVEELPSENVEGKNSTLATLATKDTLPILATEEEQAKAKEEHFRELAEKYTKKPGRKIIPLRFLVDFAGYKKDDVVGIAAQGDLSARPGICELISCGQCPTAIRGAKPVCDPCSYLGKGRAEA